jgi:hypothetical protein
MMSLNELDDLVNHVETRNFAKCIERGATPYRVHDDGVSVDTYDGLDGTWGPMGTFATKSAREKWERLKTTRESHVPANGLAHLGQRPFSARVVRLVWPENGKGNIVVKEAPTWRHVDSIEVGDAAAGIRALADDEATIIDASKEELRRLLQETATLCGMKIERSTPNAQRSTLNEEERSDTSRSTGEGAILMLAPGELEEHPEALAFWPDSEQRREDIEAVCASVAEVGGIRDPLTVCRRKDGGWWVVDGCTRLEAARRAKLAVVPCLATTIREDDIKDEVFMRNMTRTRFCSGMRVMRYLEKHMADVLETAKRTAAENGAQGGRGKKAESRDSCFSSKAIADRLKVSKKDVLGGIELLRCKYENMTVRRTRDSRTLVEATDEEREGIEEAYRRVLEGTPLRRWLPAAKGHTATEGKAKADTNYDALQARTLTSLGTVFDHWGELPDAGQVDFVKGFKKLLARAPEDVLLVVRRIASLLPPVA